MPSHDETGQMGEILRWIRSGLTLLAVEVDIATRLPNELNVMQTLSPALPG